MTLDHNYKITFIYWRERTYENRQTGYTLLTEKKLQGVAVNPYIINPRVSSTIRNISSSNKKKNMKILKYNNCYVFSYSDEHYANETVAFIVYSFRMENPKCGVGVII